MNDLSFLENYSRVRQLFRAPRTEPERKPKSITRRCYSLDERLDAVRRADIEAAIEAGKRAVSGAVQDMPDEQQTIVLSRPAWRTILEEAAAKHSTAKRHITVRDITSPARFAYIIPARQEAMWRMWAEASLSCPEIGRRIGGRNHSTVYYGIRKHARLHNLPAPGKGGGAS